MWDPERACAGSMRMHNLAQTVLFACGRETIRTRLIPHAVKWYTGEANEDDEDDDDEDDDDDDLDEDDDDDEVSRPSLFALNAVCISVKRVCMSIWCTFPGCCMVIAFGHVACGAMSVTSCQAVGTLFVHRQS